MVQIKKVSNFEVKKIPIPKMDNGSDIFGTGKFSNILIVASKKSGKTNIAVNLLKKAKKEYWDTTFFIFSATISHDPLMKKILEKATPFPDETEESEKRKIKKMIKLEKGDEPKKKERELWQIFHFDTLKDGNLAKMIEYMKVAPEDEQFVVLIDDLTQELKSGKESDMLTGFYKRNRHLRAQTITSVQNLKSGVQRSARMNMDVILLLKNLPEDTLKTVYEEQGLNMGLENFIDAYKTITGQGGYDFLYVEKPSTLKMNFTHEIVFDKEDTA